MTSHTLSDVYSLLYVLIDNDSATVLSRLGHDHVIRAAQWTGTLDFDPENLEATRVEILVPAAKLQVDEDAMCKKIGYKGGISEGDRNKTRANMLKKDQIWADKHPTISFRSTTVSAPAKDTLDVRGELTVRGKTKSVQLPMVLVVDNEGTRIKGRLLATHGDFGFKPYSAPLGALRNKEDITFVIDVLAPA